IRGRHVSREDVFAAIRGASSGPVAEGAVGAGTGTVAFGFKGGIGTSSRVTPAGHTVGVLVQSNFGGDLTILGVPVGRELRGAAERPTADGSIMMVVATDASADARNLRRLAARTMLGLGRTGSHASNGSGDFAIAFSISGEESPLPNRSMSPLFQAVIEATEEAIYNSLFRATTTSGNGHTVRALPIPETIEILKRHQVLDQR
ncbi:MAG: S58 family peptidase, partial [bacterium]|nr:S58 family peptidase [bacterium]